MPDITPTPVRSALGDVTANAANGRSSPAQATETGSKKRKSSSSDGPEASEPVNLNDIEVPMPLYGPDKNANQIRRKITRLLDSGEMKVGEFCDAIGSSNTALNRFRKQSGPTKGTQSDNAWDYFEKREIAGLKLPIKSKKAKTSGDDKSSAGGNNAKDSGHPDISDVHLPSEESDSVPIYESCDEVRKKIAAYLRKADTTLASFCRLLRTQMQSDTAPKSIQGSQLDRFRQNSGPDGGATSAVFYASYVLFEKIRIKEGKPKSKHRQEMEEAWPNGFDRERGGKNRYFYCVGSERPHIDKLGRVSFH